MIALDTTAIIDIFKGDLKLKNVIEGVNEEFVTTIINHQEIMFGLDLSDDDYKKEELYYNEFFQDVMIVSITVEASKKGSEIFWKLKHKGKDIGRFDCMIAGILLTHGINKIITRNKKHFGNIGQLEVISY